MNYAEDRLDRRARTSNDQDESTSSLLETSVSKRELGQDLRLAHSVFHSHSCHIDSSISDDASCSDDDIEYSIRALLDLSKAHELAGRTLRDGGLNRHAVFHYGMAWRTIHYVEKMNQKEDELDENFNLLDHFREFIDHNNVESCPEWKSVGDYAQMTEFAGFPEVGVIALLYFRARGSLDGEKTSLVPSEKHIREKSNTKMEQIFDGLNKKGNFRDGTVQSCGCGFIECGMSPCYVAFPLSSPLINDILRALDHLSIPCKHSNEVFTHSRPLVNPSCLTALEILNQVSLICSKTLNNTSIDRLFTMKRFMAQRFQLFQVPDVLQFWDRDTQQCETQAQDYWPDQQQTNTFRRMHPVLLLLLLKLLYSSPISGPFLRLSCYSVPYLLAMLPPSSIEGQILAKNYKSHWAYYVFISALVLGKRRKKHRADSESHQIPAWDLTFGRESIVKNESGANEVVTFSTYFLHLLHNCLLSSHDSIEEQNGLKSTSALCQSTTESILVNSTICRHYSSLPPILTMNLPHPPIYILGDSHVLSLAWHTLRIHTNPRAKNSDCSSLILNDGSNEMKRILCRQSSICRTAVPFPATGIKAYHFRPSTHFFTHSNLHACFQRLPQIAVERGSSYEQLTEIKDRREAPLHRTILMSAGEIDCREGIGGALLQKHNESCREAVERTALDYLESLSGLSKVYNLQIVLMPVAPHAYRSEKNGKASGRAKRRETMFLWNEILRRELTGICRHGCSNGPGESKNCVFNLSHVESDPPSCTHKYEKIFLLDYEHKLRQDDPQSPVGYVLHPSFNADYTHVNSAVISIVQEALEQCGCDLNLL